MTKYEDTFARQMQEVERRLRTLETAQRAAYTSITDDDGNERVRLSRDGLTWYDTSGNVVAILDDEGGRWYDAAGILRARIGYISGPLGYGVSIYDAAGGLRFEVNDDGYRDPWLPHPMIEAGIGVTITSGTFVPVYQGQVQLITHQGLSVSVVVNADVGTTAEFRVKNTDGGATTDAVSVGSGASVGHTFNWLHGSDLGGGPVRFDVEARRTSGAGNVYVFQPYTLAMADPLQCSANGL